MTTVSPPPSSTIVNIQKEELGPLKRAFETTERELSSLATASYPVLLTASTSLSALHSVVSETGPLAQTLEILR